MSKTEKKPALKEDRFKLAEHERNMFAIVPPHGTPLEALLEPSFWANVARFLQPWDHIEVRAEDGTYWCELLVMDSGNGWAKVQTLSHVELDAVAVGAQTEDHGLRVEWKGPHKKHCVIRESDKAMLKDGFSKKAEAHAWITGQIRARAA